MKILSNKYFSFFILTTLILLTSPLHPFATGFSDIDSSVFLYIGKSMAQGQFPYIDIFDHKGPIIYIINYLGFVIDAKCGVWLIEFIFLYTSIFFCYKIARQFTNKSASLTATFIVFILFGYYLQEGNLVEEYALPMIFISLYIFINYFLKDNNLNNKNAFISGLCFGGVLMLRPNMIAVWTVFYPIIILNLCFQKKYITALKHIIFISAGILTVILPVLILIIYKGAFDEFLYQYFKFNAEYSFKNGATISDRLRAFYFYSNNAIFSLTLIFFCYALLIKNYNKSKEFLLQLGLFLFLIISFISVIISGRMYEHYAMVVVPCYIVPIAYIVDFGYKKILYENRKKIFANTAIISLSFAFLMYPIATELYRIKKSFFIKNEFIDVAQTIKYNTKSTDYITVVDNKTIIYLLSNRKSASRYVYQPTGTNKFNLKVFKEFKIDLQKNEPKIICSRIKKFNNVFTDDEYLSKRNEFTSSFILNNYRLIKTTQNYLIYKKK